jgi:PAS domain S-box-containing protein
MVQDTHILAVDDEPDMVELTGDMLEREGFVVDTKTNPEEALESIENSSYDGVVSDYDMPEMDGLELLEEVRDVKPELTFILYTGRGNEKVASRAISNGVTDYIRKGNGVEDFEHIAETLEEEIEKNRTTIFEKALEERELPIDIIEDSIRETNHSIMITDYQGNIEYVNDAVTETTGYDREEILGSKPSMFQSGQYPDEFYAELWATVKNGEVWEGQILNESKEGERYTINQTITPVDFGGETYFLAINKPK